MEINSRGVPLRTHKIEYISLAYTVGVILSALLDIHSYILLATFPIIIVLCRKLYISLVLCGLFAYTSYTTCGASVDVPQFVLEWSKQLCAFIDSLPIRNSGLIKALLQGDKSGLSHDIIETFRAAGASHLLALSGLHMGIIYMIFQRFLPIKNESIRYIILTTAALTFTLMTGAKPSMVRAFLFILVGETALLCNLKLTLSQTLSCALLIQLGYNPSYITSVGFQMSYAAVVGIMVIYPKLDKCFEGKGLFKKLWQIIAITLSCQLFTAPLCWYYFHSFPLYFLITNVIMLVLTPIFMVSSIVLLILSALGICPDLVCLFVDTLGDGMLYSLKIIRTLQF